ncbi:MAG: acyl-CoA dehydrogenase family protein [Gammaproteobacteria bacterium]
MSNFYEDNKDIAFHLKNMDLTKIVQMREDNFAQKASFPEAPVDYKDAIDNYEKVLEITGEIAGEFIAPRAPDVDEQGAEFKDGEVIYAKGTSEAIDRLRKADLMGFTLPRKYMGLNLPKTIYAMAIEMVSRADAGLMNIFGLQEISDTIYRFGSEDQKERFLPRFSRGEVLGAMALTEPDAGSDLQAVTLMATEKDGKWYLNGVKRFITNGCAEISLVLARSEEGSSGGRGLSLFIYERDKTMRIRRIEDKLGIHGSPTCEMQFNNSPCELIGQRRFGLIKYTMALMNGARLAVAAQALGIAEAAYREADSYAKTRIQFGKPIREIPAIYEMLTDMKVSLEAGRSFLYEAARLVDIKEGLEETIEHHPERKAELQEEQKRYTKYAALFTPALKAYTTEMGNQVCYDALQIHGGNGFMRDFNIERHVRDVRVTNIYEGTTQLQVVAAIGGVVSGVLFERLDDYEKQNDFSSVSDIHTKAKELRSYLEKALNYLKERNDKAYQEYHERRLVEMGNDVIMSYLLCIDALKLDRKKIIAHLFISKAIPRVKASMEFILSGDHSVAEFRESVI